MNLWLLMIACSGKSADSGASIDGPGGGGNPDAPSVDSLDAWCYTHTTGQEVVFWIVQATVSDPQGIDTIPTLGHELNVYSGSSTAASYDVLLCSEGSGTCQGNFQASYDNILCDNPSAYDIGVKVVDEDGNMSQELTVPGRSGSGPEG